jgi:hypothetical protein
VAGVGNELGPCVGHLGLDAGRHRTRVVQLAELSEQHQVGAALTRAASLSAAGVALLSIAMYEGRVVWAPRLGVPGLLSGAS